MSRRKSEKCSQAAANLQDILEAFGRPDKSPLIYCEAADLVKLPPISPDSTSELVMMNGACLAEIGNTELQEGVAELKLKIRSDLSSVPLRNLMPVLSKPQSNPTHQSLIVASATRSV